MTIEEIEVIAPNLKWRLSGVTATIARLLPVQARSIGIAATGPGLPAHVPSVPLRSVVRMSGRKRRVWHARRNTEMLLGLILRYVLGKRLKLVFTSASQRIHTSYTRLLISGMDAVVATSRRSGSYLRRPARVILHGIDSGEFRPCEDRRALRRALDLPEGMLIGCYGRIRRQKGTDVFVDAMLEVLPRHSDVTALVMGRVTEKHILFQRELREKVGWAGLDGRILFLPEAPVDDMPRWYQVLDLFVAPQRREGFGLTPLEAMACGVPVIATTAGAFDELVVEGTTGRLIPPGDARRMRAAVDAAAGVSRYATAVVGGGPPARREGISDRGTRRRRSMRSTGSCWMGVGSEEKWTPIIGQSDNCPRPPLVPLHHAASGHKPLPAHTLVRCPAPG